MIETLKNKYIFLDSFNTSNKIIDCIVFDPIFGREIGKIKIKNVKFIRSIIDTCYYIEYINQQLLLIDVKKLDVIGHIGFDSEFQKTEDVIELYLNG